MNLFNKTPLNTRHTKIFLSTVFLLVTNIPQLYATGGLVPYDLNETTGLGNQWINVDGFIHNGNSSVINTRNTRSFLNWSQFNLGSGQTLQYIMPSESHISINRILGDDRSVINGQITANGRLYLLNQNGFLFGPDSIVNVNSLLVSTLDFNMSEENLASSVRDGTFNIAAMINNQQAAFLSDGSAGDIHIQPEALLETQDGGSVFMFAANIFNQGEIHTRSGQTILAASDDRVYLTPSLDPALRGFLVEVDLADISKNGNIENGIAAQILSERGNITLAGFAIKQNGRLEATTSVNENGSIRLLARHNVVFEGDISKEISARSELNDSTNLNNFSELRLGINLSEVVKEDRLSQYALATEAGDVRLGKNSQIVIRADQNDTVLATNEQRQRPSTVEITGRNIELQQNASIVANNGRVILHATSNPSDTALQINGDVGDLRSLTSASIKMAQGSLIDVSGTTDNQAAMARNQLEVQLTGNFLQDAPLQRESGLRNERILVDTRLGTALGDISALVNAGVKRGISERLSNGGSIQFISQGSVGLSETSQTNIAAGSVSYTAGNITTSQLVDSNGRVVDVFDADPNNIYQGVYGQSSSSSSRWGQSRSWRVAGGGNTQFYEAYTEGQNAGALNIIANVSEGLNNELISGTTLSRFQRFADHRPSGGEFRLNLGAANLNFTNLIDTQSVNIVADKNNTVIEQSQLDDYLNGGDNLWNLELDDNLFQSGLSMVAIKTANGNIMLEEGAKIALASQGSFTASARNITTDGDIQITSGNVALTAAPFMDSGGSIALSGALRVNGKVDVSGSWTNDNIELASSDISAPVNLQGGSIKLKAKNNADLILSEGSELSADGGAWLSSGGQLEAGEGGQISVVLSTKLLNDTKRPVLDLSGSMHAYSLARGGKLSLTANQVNIADVFDTSAAAGELRLNADFFSANGFSQYSIKSNLDNLNILSGSHIAPRVDSFVMRPGFVLADSTNNLSDLAQVKMFDEPYLRPATSLRFITDRSGSAFLQFQGNGLNIESAARIELDAGADLTLSAARNIFMNGDIRAPGGNVSLELTTDSSIQTNSADLGIWIDGNIDVSGAFVQAPVDDQNLITGTVFDAGSININARQGYVIQGESSELNVAGQSFSLDMPVLLSGNSVLEYGRRQRASNAGNIEISAAEGIHLRGTMSAQAADVSGAHGGALSIKLSTENRGDSLDNVGTQNARVIHIVQNNNDVTERLNRDDPASVLLQGGKISAENIGEAWLSVEQIESAGFDQLSLTATEINSASNNVLGVVEFDNNIDLSLARQLQIRASILSAKGEEGDIVNLSAPYVFIGPEKRIDPLVNIASGGGSVLNINAGLTAETGLLDFAGQTYMQGFGEVNLSSLGDIRLQGQKQDGDLDNHLIGLLETGGDLSFSAAQIYTTSMSEFDVSIINNPDAVLRINAGGDVSPVLSAASQLTLSAPEIQQSGVLKAPFGRITLNAERIRLNAGSVTSVSAEDQLIPLGRLLREETWLYPLNTDDLNNVINTVPERRVILAADDIVYGDGSVVDISGGGELYGWEFLPGIGGSVDNLLQENTAGAFAVIPGFADYAPYDHFTWLDTDVSVGQQIHLQQSGLLAEGNYTVLPARYALMPGAYLLTPQDQTIYAGQQFSRPDGTPIVAAQMATAGTAFHDDVFSAYAIETGQQVRLKSEYFETTASDFFTAEALRNNLPRPVLPADAGSLDIIAGESLDLAGTVRSTAGENGRGSQVNIAGDYLRVVNVKDNTGGIELLVENLSNLNADSLLLGGVRQRTDEGTLLTVTASVIDIEDMRDNPQTAQDESASLQIADLILVAQDNINIKEGADIRAINATGEQDSRLIVNDDGALLRASSARQADIVRHGSEQPLRGRLNIAAGSRIEAAESLLFDASLDTQIKGQLVMQGGSLNLGASRISLGGEGLTGLSLTENDFSSLSLNELVLSSRSSVDVYGGFNQSFDRLRINAAALDGYGDEASSLTANELVLANLGGFNADDIIEYPHTGTAELNLNAQTIRFEQGDVAIRGFGQLNLTTANDIVLAENGTLNIDVAAAINLHAGRITAANGVNYRIDGGASALNILSSELSNNNERSVGAQLSIRSRQINHGGFIDLASGVVSLQASGDNVADNVLLLDGSVIDVSGITRDFAGEAVNSSGGVVKLLADQGSINMETLANINVSGGAGEANAGEISVTAAQGEVNLLGQLVARSSTAGGRFVSNSNSIADLFALNSLLNTAGFSEKRHIRLGSGDLEITTNDRIIARDVLLQADAGSIQIDGQIDARAETAGQVHLAASDNIELSSSALIDVSATGLDETGGRLFIESKTGTVNLLAGSVINVSGTGTAAGGEVYIRSAKTAGLDNVLGTSDDDIKLKQMDADVQGFDRFILEAYQAYDISDGNVASADWTQASADASNFMNNNNVENIFNRLNLSAQMNAAELDKVHLRPGIEFSSANDLSITSAQDFLSDYYQSSPPFSFLPQTLSAPEDLNWRYTVNRTDASGNDYLYNEPGIVSFVSASDLSVKANISDGVVLTTVPFSLVSGISKHELLPEQPLADAVQGLETWSYRFIAGHDQTAASVFSVTENSGDFTLANGRYIRTGTGNIDVYAGNNIIMQQKSSIQTVGQSTGRGSFDIIEDVFGFPLRAMDELVLPGIEFPELGGDIQLTAGGNIIANPDSLFVNDWLHRGSFGDAGNKYSLWGVRLESFRDGVGALGGGDVSIAAGGNIENLAVSIPTTGKQLGEVNLDVNLLALDFPGKSLIEVQGAGNIYLTAGGDLDQSMLYAGNGEINVDVFGSVGNSAVNSGLFLVAENTQANINANGTINLQGVANPSLMPASRQQILASNVEYFSTYNENTNISLVSLGGDINLRNRLDLTDNLYSTVLNLDSTDKLARQEIARRYPAGLSAISISGDINFGNIKDIKNDAGQYLSLMPSAQGNLRLLANENILALNQNPGNSQLYMMDLDPSAIADMYNPIEVLKLPDFIETGLIEHAKIPLHINDNTPARIVANNGDIASTNINGLGFRLDIPKAFELIAGRDIHEINLHGQNINASDISVVRAGRDINYAISTSSSPSARSIEIEGPGELYVMAGRDIDLGNQRGIRSVANQLNPALSDSGAELYILAGLGQQGINLNGFIDTYLLDNSAYAQALIEKMSADNFSAALLAFNQLPEKEQQSFIINAYFNEVRQSANRAAKEQNRLLAEDDTERFGYSQGLNAFATLFPGSVLAVKAEGLLQVGDSLALNNGEHYIIQAEDIITTGGFDYVIPKKNQAYQGNVRLISSTILGDADGSNISVLVPGGILDVGLASESQGKRSDLEGIITRGDGDINLFVHDDVSVNLSRIQALNGGGITIWSNVGDLDAGRGAKSALSIQAPRIIVDADGSIQQIFQVDVTGSGIQTKVFKQDRQPGDVVLAAVAGVIDAGDAGIAAGGSLTLATDTVLNAAQIESGGDSVGVPAASTGVAVDLGNMDVSNTSGDGSKQTELIAQDVSDKFGAGSIAILQVEVLDLENEMDRANDELNPSSDKKHKKLKLQKGVQKNKKTNYTEPELSMLR